MAKKKKAATKKASAPKKKTTATKAKKPVKKAKAKKAPAKAKAKVRTSKAAKKAPAKTKAGSKRSARPAAAKTATNQVHEAMIFGRPSGTEIPHDRAPVYYALVEASDLSSLTRLVQTKMTEGWVPTGGIAMTPTQGLTQAIVRY